MKFSVKLFCLLSVFLILNACKKDPQPGPDACLKLYDTAGSAIGSTGDCSNDESWGESTFTAQQTSFLSFTDNVSTTGTQEINVTGVQAYPIPVQLNSVLNFTLTTTDTNKSTKVKMAIVDSNNDIVDEIALTRVTGVPWQINLPDSRYKAEEYYRVYYQLSADGSPNYFEGYGDFLVCGSTNTNCYE